MKVGDMVLSREVRNQTEHKWVVLSPLKLDEDEHVIGGRIYGFFGKNKEAEEAATTALETGERALVLQGLVPGIKIGEVFVD
ncbi:MAG: hypothetical protein LBE35_07870 [Clostridiales bacterium]|nr:hypothetical protein [Clostridiales bacterium]